MKSILSVWFEKFLTTDRSGSNIVAILTQVLFFSLLTILVLVGMKCSLQIRNHLQTENAIWSESMYLRGYRPSTGYRVQTKDIVNFARQMRKHNVNYFYLFAGPFEPDGKLPKYPFQALAKKNLELMPGEFPEAVILPWVGGIQHRTVQLENSKWITNG